MYAKRNCWEYLECGREPGGSLAAASGVCPAAAAAWADGTNGGRMGGRLCWAIAGTFCHGEVQGDAAAKRATCMSCSFFRMVRREEGDRFVLYLE